MYNFKEVEKKWSERWEEEGTNSPSMDEAENHYYNLMMFPYPSGEGLHVGHTYAFGGADTFGRFKRLQGYDVFQPMGFDAFGIHSENFAIKKGMHPEELIEETTSYFRDEQMRPYGGMWDWSREVNTTDVDYYKWTQWLFVQLFKNGLVERKESSINWCPSCKTVLSDEQVESKDGVNVCERCKSEVSKKTSEQWFFKITEYSEELLDYHGTEWPETTAEMQKNWIGRSEGARINFELTDGREIEIFTTRPDTLFGATFFVLAPEHPLADEMEGSEIEEYLKKVDNKTEVERKAAKEKTGVLTDLKIINPVNGEEIPVYVADYVMADYGTGAIMAVPAHDERDLEFAEKFGIEVREVIKEGEIINSGEWNGLSMDEVLDWIEDEGVGEREVNYKLRDWCISRQRYWGPPIPMIYCEECGWNPEEDLPVELPYIEDYQPKGEGKSPLADLEDWIETECPQCGGEAERETDVSDTFLDSSWYFLRYPSTDIDDKPFDKERTEKWLPVDSYIGGNEHALLHLMYSRFITMALNDMGYIDFREPFKRFYAHGLIIKDGNKMSKSRGNVVNPTEYMDEFGADALRMYLLFLGSYDQGGDFKDEGMQGMKRFLDKVYRLFKESMDSCGDSEDLDRALHKTIKKVGEDLGSMKFNTAIASIMKLTNVWKHNIEEADKSFLRSFALILAPLAPHLAEEMWSILGEEFSIFDSEWPEYNEDLIKTDNFELVIQIDGQVRDRVIVERGISESEAERVALERENVQKHLNDREVKRSILVPNQLVNLVTE